jgi:hypothetical protein
VICQLCTLFSVPWHISRDNGVVIATGYVLNGRDIGVRVLVGTKFSLLHVVQTGSGARPDSFPIGNGGFSPEVKWPKREADSLLELVSRSRKFGAILPLSHMSS